MVKTISNFRVKITPKSNIQCSFLEFSLKKTDWCKLDVTKSDKSVNKLTYQYYLKIL